MLWHDSSLGLTEKYKSGLMARMLAEDIQYKFQGRGRVRGRRSDWVEPHHESVAVVGLCTLRRIGSLNDPKIGLCLHKSC
jgi:hypothetical protein